MQVDFSQTPLIDVLRFYTFLLLKTSDKSSNLMLNAPRMSKHRYPIKIGSIQRSDIFLFAANAQCIIAFQIAG
jgi:hypothetical protein